MNTTASIHYDLLEVATPITVHGDEHLLEVNIPVDGAKLTIDAVGTTGFKVLTITDIMGNILWRHHTAKTVQLSPYEHIYYVPVSPVYRAEDMPEREDGALYMGFRPDDIELVEVG